MLDAEGNAPVRANVPGRKFEPIDPQELTAEEVKMYKACMNGMFFKAGLPFAAFMHILSSWKSKPDVQEQPPAPKTLRFPLKRAFFFSCNMIFGTLLFAPFCFGKLLEGHNLEKKKKAEVLDAPAPEKTQPIRLPDDFQYPPDLTLTFNDAESTFNPEFSTSKILGTEDEPKLLSQGTTYEDLRNKHRSSYQDGLSQSPLSERPKSANLKPSTGEREPQKFVKRNKYGDEIE